MTEHLGDRVSPLIDHQLDHDARDRALAHLAGCADCQREVAALRQVKARLVTLGDPALPDAVAARLLSIGAGMAGPGRPEPECAPRLSPSSPPRRPDATGHGRSAAQPIDRLASDRLASDRLASRRRSRRGATELPGRTRHGSRAARQGAGHRQGARPGGSRDHLRRRPSPPPRSGPGRASMRRTLLGSAALLMLAVAGAAVSDGRGTARPAGPIAVPTVSSVVSPGSPAGGSLRLIPMFAPMKVSLRR
ncbi:zf-HC2 domain-containing protein [Frankia sp. AiPs1]|uniref:anti-sigma factor family protein n=1 Tax=Frankia sp. AiPs1 TaxID=573493 RepID=UPI0020444FDA|nr:zf-HC2 domain-containing protein [Frankia sp. AiPs1]MCM3925292.1 zf-HC2 domain-containing protein [Frankia sp. AiPs1]